MSEAQFVDLCIVMACDYCSTIKHIGPAKALQGIRKHRRIEPFLTQLHATDKGRLRHTCGTTFLDEVSEARRLFAQPPIGPVSAQALADVTRALALAAAGVQVDHSTSTSTSTSTVTVTLSSASTTATDLASDLDGPTCEAS